MRILFGLTLLASFLSLSGQDLSENSDWAKEQPYVIMVSIDGFRYDYAEKFGATNILKLKASGSSAEAMIPSFPSKTFPNHYTLVTGLIPNHHGVVGNSFYSREKAKFFSLANKDVVTDSSWYGGVPIWSLAEQNGMLTASYFWAGSEARIDGFRPTYWKKYSHKVPHEERIQQVIHWMKLPPESKPHLLTLYFSLVDDAGHKFGPDANETKEAVLKVDGLIGMLQSEIEALGLPVYLIVTSDHGMAAVNRGVSLHDVKFKDAIVDYSSTMAMVYHDDPKVIGYIRRQLEKKTLLQVYSRDEMSEKYGFDNQDRVGDLVILSEPPVQILKSPSPVAGGAHGYDPLKFSEMNATFVITGPKIKSGLILDPFRNVNVYPVIASLLGLPIPDNLDSDLDVLGLILESN